MARSRAHRLRKYRQTLQRRPRRAPSPCDRAPSTTEMAFERQVACRLLYLPVELTLDILEYLELEELKKACRAYPELEETGTVAKFLHRRQREEDFKMRECNSQWRYHRLLFWILTDTYSPDTLTELDVGRNWCMAQLCTGTDAQQVKQHKNLFRAEFSASPWFDNRKRKAFMADLLSGNGDAAVALVLPRLWNVRSFSPPVLGRWTLELMQSISRAQTLATSASIQYLPLRRVNHVILDHEWPPEEEYPTWMPEMLGTLRTVKRVAIPRLSKRTFQGWRKEMLRPICPEVMIFRPQDEKIVEDFAAGWGAPCVVRVRGRPGPDECDCFCSCSRCCNHPAADYDVYKARFDNGTSAMSSKGEVSVEKVNEKFSIGYERELAEQVFYSTAQDPVAVNSGYSLLDGNDTAKLPERIVAELQRRARETPLDIFPEARFAARMQARAQRAAEDE